MWLRICIIAVVLFTGGTAAAANEEWLWYYAGFEAPSLDARPFIRGGTATFTKSGRTVTLKIREPGSFPNPVVEAPYVRATVAPDGRVSGTISDFFEIGSSPITGQWHHSMRPSQSGKLCATEEIELQFVHNPSTGARFFFVNPTYECLRK
jgi:hypothetical protein